MLEDSLQEVVALIAYEDPQVCVRAWLRTTCMGFRSNGEAVGAHFLRMRSSYCVAIQASV